MPDSYSSGNRPRSGAPRTGAPRSSASRGDYGRPSGTRSAGTRSAGTSRTGTASRSTSGRYSSADRRPASSGSVRRPSSARPGSSSSGTRRPVRRRRRKTVQPRFFLMIGVLVVIIIAVILLTTGKNPSVVAPTPTPTADPSNGVQTGVVVQSSDPVAENPVSVSPANVDTDTQINDADSDIEALNDADRVQVDDLSINTSLPQDWINILLLGTDERIQNDRARTDTMIICSINTNTGKVKLSSIMRDSAYQVIGNSKYNGKTYRINTANYFGGPNYAMKIVNHYLDMNIQYYATVNFFGFQKIATALGGIDVDISETEMNEINRKQYEQARIAINNGWDEEGIENEKLTTFGPNTHLNGRQTVAYARVRKIDSDFSRAERQRTVLSKLMEKLKGKSSAELIMMATSLLPNVTTNMDFNMIMDIAMKVLSNNVSIGTDNMFRLPVRGTFTEERRGEDAMLFDIDWKTNSKELYNFIYES